MSCEAWALLHWGLISYSMWPQHAVTTATPWASHAIALQLLGAKLSLPPTPVLYLCSEKSEIFWANCWSFDSCSRFLFTENHFLTYLLRSLIKEFPFLWQDLVSNGFWCLVFNCKLLTAFLQSLGSNDATEIFAPFVLKYLLCGWRLESALCDWQL